MYIDGDTHACVRAELLCALLALNELRVAFIRTIDTRVCEHTSHAIHNKKYDKIN